MHLNYNDSEDGLAHEEAPLITITKAGRNLLWQDWKDVYILYQPSSTETHVFNETTAFLLKSLNQGPLSMRGVTDWTLAALGVEKGDLIVNDLKIAAERLEELGLIKWSDNNAACQ